ncbi:MAG: transposase [Daejeonella sp.]
MGLRNRNQFKDKICFFVTTTCHHWICFLGTVKRKLIVAESLNFVQKKYNISILGYVIMPNHIHLLLYFNIDNKLSDAMRDLKKYTSTHIRKDIEASGDHSLFEKLKLDNGPHVFKVWQDRFDDVWIGDRKILETKLDYIHFNPLQAHWNLVKEPEEYIFSSASFYNQNNNTPVFITDYRNYF